MNPAAAWQSTSRRSGSGYRPAPHRLLGFHYWVLAVPQVIAGVAAVLVLFWMLLPRCGLKVATTAAALLAITPISVASARNNSLDTITMFLLLLAAWSLLRALDSGHDRWLIFTAVLVGLAFNTKMFMAFLPLPAFAIAYGWVRLPGPRKLPGLMPIAGIFVAVSLAWVALVGMTPASKRPYVYNSYGNNIWALTFGFNGIYRVVGRPPQDRIRSDLPNQATAQQVAGSEWPDLAPWRLFLGRLGSQIGWFLPSALLGAFVLLRSARRDRRQLLWPAWFLSGVALLSLSASIEPQYLEIIAAPTAVCAAIGLWSIVDWAKHWPRKTAALIVLLTLYPIYLLISIDHQVAFAVTTGLLGVASLGVIIAGRRAGLVANRALALCLAGAILLGAGFWSITTVAAPATGSAARYPIAGPLAIRDYPPAPGGDQPPIGSTGDDAVLAYLVDHTGGEKYLVGTERSLFGDAARYILQVNRPVLTLDSFTTDGQAAASLSQLVTRNQLRFLELPIKGPWSNPASALGHWFLASCRDITTNELQPLSGDHLYDCQSQPGANSG